MQGFWSKLRQLIRWGSVVRGGKDDAQFPIQQVRYHDKVADTVMLFPYGMHANVDGNALGPLFIFGGNPEDRAMLPTSMNNRNQLAPGDVEVYSPVSGSRVTIKADGTVEVDGADVTVTTSGDLTATVSGDMTANVTGAVTVTAASADVTAATVAVTGNVTITGTLTVSGVATVGALSATGAGGGSTVSSLNVTGTLSQGGTDVGAGHVHSGVATGTSNTGAVV